MPNKRDPNKVMVGIYVDRELRDTVMGVLREHNATLTDFFYYSCLKLLKKQEHDIIKILENRDLRTLEGKTR